MALPKKNLKPFFDPLPPQRGSICCGKLMGLSNFDDFGPEYECSRCKRGIRYSFNAEEKVYFAVEEYWAERYDCEECLAA